ncbi:phage major tail protein [Escherichia coli]|uniref:Phage major tail protein n=1 Tax=Escherichia coli TaxID=562 RepID=A0A376TZZ1_ECOLX|nr:phage major tail protein [Escherichia coli]
MQQTRRSERFPPIRQREPLLVKDMVITVTGVKAGKVSIPVISGNGQFATVAEVTVTEAGAAG